MKRVVHSWEYKVFDEDTAEKAEEQLNLLGREGWEVISVATPRSGYYLYRYTLKRYRGQIEVE